MENPSICIPITSVKGQLGQDEACDSFKFLFLIAAPEPSECHQAPGMSLGSFPCRRNNEKHTSASFQNCDLHFSPRRLELHQSQFFPQTYRGRLKKSPRPRDLGSQKTWSRWSSRGGTQHFGRLGPLVREGPCSACPALPDSTALSSRLLVLQGLRTVQLAWACSPRASGLKPVSYGFLSPCPAQFCALT